MLKALVPGGKSPLEEKASPLSRLITGIGKKGREITNEVFGAKAVIDEVVASEVKRSNQLLAQLVQLTAQMVGNQGTNNTPIIMQNQGNSDMSGSMQGPGYADAKTNFLNSTYSMQP